MHFCCGNTTTCNNFPVESIVFTCSMRHESADATLFVRSMFFNESSNSERSENTGTEAYSAGFVCA